MTDVENLYGAEHVRRYRETGGKVGHDQPRVAAEHLRLASRQMELLVADIDPHVRETHVHVGVARKAEPDDVEQRRQRLIVNAHVDVFERDDVADVLGAGNAGPFRDRCCHG